MSGRGQHFIPQHFQKPFVFSEEKDQIWMYRRGKEKAIPLSRKDAGKEHDFYSSPSDDGSQTLDDLITEYEHKIFPIVDILRKIQIGSAAESEHCAEIVVHFFIRSQHLRKTVSEIWSGLAKIIYGLATNSDTVIGSRRLPAHRPPKAIASAINEQIISHQIEQLSNINSETLVRIIYMGLREKIDELAAEARRTVAQFITQFGDQAKEKIRDLHRGILMSSMAPIKRIEQLRALSWTIIGHPDTAAILPDCVCIAANSSGVWQPILLAEELSTVVMPLTPNTLLIGKRYAGQEFDPSIFNYQAAKCCFDFFLSKENIALDSLLDGDLGHSIRTEINDMVSVKVLEAIDTYLTVAPSDQELSITKNELNPELQKQYEYQVALYDFGNEDYASKLTFALKELVNNDISLETGQVLDGFTFANEYEEAINSIDRGFEYSQTIKSTDSPLGMGVAIPLTVKRGEQLKTRFVVRAFIADMILSENDDERASAISTIRYLLGGLELDLLLRTRFSGWMLQKIENPIEDYFYDKASGIFDIYFGMRRSPNSLDEAAQHLDDLEEHLPDMISICIERRRLYRLNSDLEGFLLLVFEQSKLILNQIARILGISSGFEGRRVIPDRLAELLSRFDMGDWLRLFSNDLSYFYENLANWENFEEVFFTNRHFERWLLLFGVIIQDNGDGKFYAHVPFGSDAEYLSQIGEHVPDHPH